MLDICILLVLFMYVDINSNFAMKIIVHVNNPVDIIVKTIENTRAPSSSVSLTPVPIIRTGTRRLRTQDLTWRK